METHKVNCKSEIDMGCHTCVTIMANETVRGVLYEKIDALEILCKKLIGSIGNRAGSIQSDELYKRLLREQ